jgi:hypothetical protein
MLSVLTELFLALLAAAGLMSLICLLLIRALFQPNITGEKSLTLIPASGDGRTLDLTVHRLLFLRRWGLYHGKVAVVDCGLDEVGQTIVRLLRSDCGELILCSPEDLPRLIP